MHDLGLTLATTGQLLLMERRQGRALVARYAEMREPRGGRARAPKALAPRLDYARSVVPSDGYLNADGIAVIDIAGMLTPDGYYDWWTETFVPGYAQIGAAVMRAQADATVKGLFIRADSPGGLADGAFDLARIVREGREKAGGKPVWAHTGWACSAAYGAISGSDRIICTPQGYTGSIGALILHVDESEWLAELGIRIEPIESAAGKTAGASFKPLDEAARAHMRADIDQLAKDFVATVAAGRGLSAEAIRAQEARIFLARHDDPALSAMALGLVDAVGTEREAFEALGQHLAAKAATTLPPPSSGPRAARAKGSTMRGDKETKAMSLTAQMEALRVKAAAGDGDAQAKLDAIAAILEDEEKSAEEKLSAIESELAEEPEEDEGEEPPPADGEKPEARTAKGKAKAKAGKAKASAQADGFAVLKLPEAKGRESQAVALGEKVAAGKLSVDDAKEILAASPKASRLGAAMEGRDVALGSGGGSGTPNGAKALASSMQAALKNRGLVKSA